MRRDTCDTHDTHDTHGVPDLGLLAIGVLGVSTSGPLIAATSAPALAVAFWRNGIAAALTAPWVLLNQRAELRSMNQRAVVGCLLAGLMLALHFAAWMPSLTMTSVASSTALVCMQAVWTAVLSRLVGERLSRSGWFGMALSLLGVIVLSGVDLTISRRALLGDLLALLGGGFSAAYVVIGGRVRQSVATSAYTALCYSTCAAVLLAVSLLGHQSLGGYRRADWLRIVALTVSAQLLGHSLFNRLLRTTSPTVVSTAVLLEVPGAGLLAAVFLGQHPPWAALPALAMLLCGLMLVVRAQVPPGETAES